MKQLLPISIIAISLIAGAGIGFHDEIYPELNNLYQTQFSSEVKEHNHSSHNHSGEFEFGTAHEHALMYIVVNGSEMKFRESKYQVTEDYVHLENGNSHIVHKHAKGVTWNDFLDTINVSITRSEETCVKAKNTSNCGNGTVWMNGETEVSLDKKISQDDRLIIAVGENVSETLSRYYSKQLPKAYTPEESRGRRL